MPPATLRLTVLPSQIQFNERIYSQISDHGFNNTVYIRGSPSQYIDKIGVYPEVEFLMEETARSGQLKVKFQVQSRAVSANYLGYQNHLDKAVDERWDRKHVPYNLQSIRPWTLWRKMYQHTIQRIEHCWHSKVEVLTQRASLGSDLVSTLSWTGDCSELPSIGDPNWLPGADEWILVDYSLGSNYSTDVIRARLIFIYYIVCNLDRESRVRLVRPGKCFLCVARMHRQRRGGQERIVIHSFLDDPTAVEILCTDVEDSSQSVDPVPTTLTPAPQSSPEPPPAPSVPSTSAVASRKRKKIRK